MLAVNLRGISNDIRIDQRKCEEVLTPGSQAVESVGAGLTRDKKHWLWRARRVTYAIPVGFRPGKNTF